MNLNGTALNLLRIYATALVFLCHSTIIARESFGYEIKDFLFFRSFFLTPAWGGVWIFLTIGGFLAAYGFDIGKYSLDKAGIKNYYKGRIVKILIPTYIFISLSYIFNMHDSKVTFGTILQWLTCTFNGHNAGITYVGASWYVFILMWLYLLSPYLYKWMLIFEKKRKGKELKSYCKLSFLIFIVGILYRFSVTIIDHFNNHQLYYDWGYANVLCCLDIFFIGMIGERVLHFLPEIAERKIVKLRNLAVAMICLSTIVFMGEFKYLITVYHFLGAFSFSFSTLLLLVFYNLKISNKTNNSSRIVRFSSLLSANTFTFYLWHSLLLGYVANKIDVQNIHMHYFAMLTVGTMVTAYVAFLMTKMNNGIIKIFK